MFFPLKDENPAFRKPVVTVTIIVLCTLVFLWEAAAGEQGMQQIVYRFGLVPSVFLGSQDFPAGFGNIAPPLSIVTSMFLHGGWMHLIGNMVYLWIFGNNIEDELGHLRFIAFYLFSGLGAAALQLAMGPGSDIPMVGASGAISGVLGAYLILYPRARILTLVFLGFFITTARIAAAWFLGIWFGMQALFALTSDSAQGGVAFWAHVGGFVAGIGLLFLLRPRRAAKSVTPPPPPAEGPWRGPWG
jgi:rhomboid family protein